MNTQKEISDLSAERATCRSRIDELVCAVKQIQERLSSKELSIDVIKDLNRSLIKVTKSIDNNIARVESINKAMTTIDKLFERGVDVTHN